MKRSNITQKRPDFLLDISYSNSDYFFNPTVEKVCIKVV